MRKTIVILLLINLYTTVYSQIIRGKIMDLNTEAGIDFAAVYFSGTSTGTHTDLTGYFELDISLYKSMPLTISALGYYSVTLSDFSHDKPNFIYLNIRDFKLSEVTITAKNRRRGNLNIFKREFLGTTLFARSCNIENENDVMFIYNPKRDTLKAFSSNPIIIYNHALGYKIVYYLNKFEYGFSNSYLRIIGNVLFIADTTNFINLQKQFDRNRRSAFFGSRMHFLRSLWGNNLAQERFVVTDSSNVELRYNKIVTQTDSLSKYISYPRTLFIKYGPLSLQTQINVVNDYAYFDENGFFDPLRFFWQGNMAEKRIGDLLPFEYKPK